MTSLKLVASNPSPTASSGDGGGPEDPMLEQRVGRLEEKADRIEAAVLRIDGMVQKILETQTKQSADIHEIKATGAKQADLNKLQLEVSEIKTTSAKQADLNKLQIEVAEFRASAAKQADLTRVQADIGEVKGRLTGIEGRFTQIPTIWHLFVFIVTVLVGMAGLMFTAGKFLHP